MSVTKALLAGALLASPALTVAQPQGRPVATPAANAPIPLSAFARLPQTENPRISANGSAIAAKVRHNGRQALAVIPLNIPDARPEVIYRDEDANFDGSRGRRVTGWDWIDDDNLLIWIGQQGNVDGQDTNETRVIAWNRQTKQITQLGWRDCFISCGNVIWRSRSGPPRILISRNASGHSLERIGNQEVISVDVTTGRQERVVSPRRGVRGWFADGEGNVRLGFETDGQTGNIKALYRRPGEANFRTIINQRMERYRETPIPLVFLPNDRAIVQSRHENFSAVYEMDLNSMEFVRRIFGVDGYDVASVDGNFDQTGLGRVTVFEEGLRHYHFEPRLREIQGILDESYGAGRARIVSADHERENLIVRVGGPSQAGGFYLYSTETGDVRRVGWINNELADREVNPVRTVRYQARDGKSIQAVVTLPRGREPRNLPLIVLPHGGPWARDYEDFDMWAQPLAEMGYAVIQPNFRGSSGYGYEWEAASDGNWGNSMQDDLLDAIAYMSAQGMADRSRVCIMGWSYGGYAASRAAQRDGEHYRCAISGAGVHDLPTMVAYDRNYLGRYGSQYLGSAASRLVDVSPARFASQYSIPILIVHGAQDQRVPVAQSRNLVARLRAAGKVEGRDFVYLEQPENTHNLPREADRVEFMEAVKRFLERHNPV